MGQEKIQGKANVGTRRKVSNSYLEPYKNNLGRIAEEEKKANIWHNYNPYMLTSRAKFGVISGAQTS